MAPRATWTGHLKLSLISIPVRLYHAVTSMSHVRLHLLHRGCNQRIHYQSVCSKHGAVQAEQVVKGYEYEKGKYAVVDEPLLDSIKLETTKMIEIVQFIDASEFDPIYLNTPYYLAPDGPLAEEAFRVVREAMRRTGRLAVGRVVMAGREHVVVIGLRDKGLQLTTLRYDKEVHAAEPYFADIEDKPVNREQLALAERLIESKSARFDPARFRDRYDEALTQVIKAKIEGAEPVLVQEAEMGKVVDFMEALRRSVTETAKAKAVRKRPAAASVKRVARGRKRKQSG